MCVCVYTRVRGDVCVCVSRVAHAVSVPITKLIERLRQLVSLVSRECGPDYGTPFGSN